MDRPIPDHGDNAGQFRRISPVEVRLVPFEIRKGRFGVVALFESFKFADQLMLVIVVNNEILRQSAAAAQLRCLQLMGVAPVGIGRQNDTATGLYFTDRQSE